MVELVVLGLIVFFIYAFIRLLTSFSGWMQGAAIVLIASSPAGFMADTRAGESAIRPRSASGTREPWCRVGLAPVVPGQPANPRTRVVARFRRGIPFRLELAPVSRPAPPQPPKGTRIVKTGDPEFDRWIRRPGQRCGDGPRLPGPSGALGHRPSRAARSPRRDAGLDQSGTASGSDRPQPGPEHRGADSRRQPRR